MLLRILITVLVSIPLILAYLWTIGALYYDAGSRFGFGWLWPVLWTLLLVLLIWFLPRFWPWFAVALLFAGILVWWLSLRPSNDRNWDPSFSRVAQFTIDGDWLTVSNVRNSNYRTLQDYDLVYETRRYRLSDLRAVDAVVLYWGSQLVSHPIVVFDFGDGRPLSVSIEVRYLQDQKYSILRGLYRQNEIMYVVADERDAILRRSKYSENQDCYLYRLQLTPTEQHELLFEYISETNEVARRPRWYHAITANCTTSIFRQNRNRSRWDCRILINGTFDHMLYDRGRLCQDLPFAELRKASLINERANAADLEKFSEAIREPLPCFGEFD